ncbi:MAG TPA: patatin-like phospholipase family protein [Steroidobacteraceae bacterium]|nr:patatin-like phospholipase family protein [Steroidobacteraceae bacterium]
MPRIPALACLLLLALPAAAGESAAGDSDARPRIGLVLSGGGARGLAHVGVLRVLEEHRVPIDAIAGTSMGAVIGGLYASGMTATEIEALMSTLDWNEAFRDRSPRRDMNFRRKQDDREFLVRFPLGVKGGDLRVPRGLIQGQKLTQILRRETIGVSQVTDFDRLPTPFRAVATDLETGERVVLANGDLTEALRASMSAPGVFAPVEIGGRLLVDGGLVENLPVDVAKAMGVDLVIAVDVGFQPVGRKELNSALAVSNQMLTIMMLRETARQRALLGAADLLIEPALGIMQSTDFTATVGTIKLGTAAAQAQAARLAALSVDEARWAEYAAARTGAASLPAVQFVRADERSARYRERIEAELAPVVGRPLDPQAMERHLSRLYGDDNFESVDYRVVRDGELKGIEVSARRKSWGPNYIRFGLELQDDFEGSNSFNAGVRALITDANRYGAEWQTDLQVGANPRFRTELYQPMGYASPWFVAPRLSVERRLFDILDGDDRLATYRIRDAEAGLDLGRELGSWGEWRVGVVRGEGKRNLLVGDPADPDLPPRSDFDRGELYSRFSVDRLDDVYFPRDGELFTLQWNAPRESLGADADADRISFDWQLARSRGRSTVVLSASGGARVSGEVDAVQDFYSLGGLFNLSGLSPDSLSGPHFGIARAIYYRRIGKGQEGFLNVPTYLGASLELGNVWQRRSDMDLDSARTNGALFLGFDTFLGPVYLAAGFDEEGGRSFYLLLGRIR